MADENIKQVMQDAILDADSLERFINGSDSETVLTRLSAEYPTLQKALKTMFENGGLPATPFATKAEMEASALVDGDYAVVTDSGADNGLYVKTAGVWVKSDYDKLNAPRYMPTATTDINTLTEAGIYMPHTDQASVNFGLPSQERGVLFVTGSYYPNQFMQIYFTPSGTFMRRSGDGVSWDKWTSSFSSKSFTKNDNADDYIDAGIYASSFSGATPSTANLPYDDDRFMLIVTKSSSARQLYISKSGVAFRYSNTLFAYGEWNYIRVPESWNGILRYEGIFSGGKSLDTIYRVGDYTSNISSSGFDNAVLDTPFDDIETKFHLTVDNTGLTSRQYYHSPIGVAARSVYLKKDSSGELIPDPDINNGEWTNWSGIKYPADKITDIGLLEDRINNIPTGIERKDIYGWGSSTLQLAGSYLSQLAEIEGYTYVDHGVGGETLAVSGMQQGSNVVTVKFADATLTNNTNHAVTITQSFKPKRGRSYKEVELSNGAKGLLYFSENNGALANTFKPTNLTEPLEVDTTYEYRAINPNFINQGKGLYYFNIGKNNMGYDDTAQDIVDAQQEMIDYIPEGSEYLVGGHFINVGLAGTDYGNKVAEVNRILKLRFGKRFCDYYDFLYDDAAWQKHGITKTQADIDAISNGDLPPSLGRDLGGGTRDTGHLRDEMSEEIAIQAINRFKELGYIK